MHGFINVLKPTGCTSAAVVGIVKRTLGVKSAGHMGTLDPFGAGVLPIAIGKAPKLFDIISEKQKTYRAVFSFGWETDTVDSQGKTISENSYVPTQSEIENKLNEFVGKISQIPPKYSAIKIEGQRAYDLARSGANFTIKSREVNIYSFKLIEKITEQSYLFEIVCSLGTYIRSLCTDLAFKLGTTAVMTAIIRTKSGVFDINNAVTLEDLKQKKYEILPPDYALPHLNSVTISDDDVKKLLNGISTIVENTNSGLIKIILNDKFMGLGEITDNKLKLRINFL